VIELLLNRGANIAAATKVREKYDEREALPEKERHHKRKERFYLLSYFLDQR
jgi:hypothetical protein